jgi:hypothetical protein
MRSSAQLTQIKLLKMLPRSRTSLMLSRKSMLLKKHQKTLALPRKRRRLLRQKRRRLRSPSPRKIEKITHHQSQLPRLNHQRLRLHQPHQLQLTCHQSLPVLSVKEPPLHPTCHQSSPVPSPRRDKKCSPNKWQPKSLKATPIRAVTATVIEE